MSTLKLRRLIVERPVEFRKAAAGSDSPGVLFGYACTFDTVSRDLGGWREVIDPGTFVASLADQNRVMCRAEHDSRLLLGTTDAGTLRVSIDKVGVLYEVDLPNTNAGRDVAELAARGDYRFSSFAFYENAGEWDADLLGEGSSELVWRVLGGVLVDVAPVADPAYWTSSVAKRDLDVARAFLHIAVDLDTSSPASPMSGMSPMSPESPASPVSPMSPTSPASPDDGDEDPGTKDSGALALRETQTAAARLSLLHRREIR